MTPNLEIFGLYSNSAIKIMAFNLEIPCPPLRSNRNVYARVKNYFDIRQNPPRVSTEDPWRRTENDVDCRRRNNKQQGKGEESGKKRDYRKEKYILENLF